MKATVKYTNMPPNGLEFRFLIQIDEPVKMTPEILFIPASDVLRSADALSALRSKISKLWKERCPEIELSEIELVECDILVPK